MLYLDTSLVVALFTPEEHTERVQHWIGQDRDTLLCVSRWVDVEFAATIAAKVRAGSLAEGAVDGAPPLCHGKAGNLHSS